MYAWVLILHLCTGGPTMLCDGRSMMGMASKAQCLAIGREQMKHPYRVQTGQVRIIGSEIKVAAFSCVPAVDLE